jgi:hypothetical protein
VTERDRNPLLYWIHHPFVVGLAILIPYLVLLVLLGIRGFRIGPFAIALPIVLVAVTTMRYFQRDKLLEAYYRKQSRER